MHSKDTTLVAIHLSCCLRFTTAWVTLPASKVKVLTFSNLRGANFDQGVSSAWSETDDWSFLSSDHELNSSPDSEALFNQDLGWTTARDFEAAAPGNVTLSQEDAWLGAIVDEIHNAYATLEGEPPLFDSSFDETNTVTNDIDAMSTEIAMLVRCNQQPDDLLISEGRALPPLTDSERNNVFQLVSLEQESMQSTEFFKQSVSRIFHEHATADPSDGSLCLDRKGIANWMTKSLKTEEGRVSAHDSRVLKILSDFSSYGSGRLLEEDFQNLYLTTVKGKVTSDGTGTSWKRHLARRQPYVDAVWRDLRNHGILAPVEQERKRIKDMLPESSPSKSRGHTMMDECEILDWDYSESSVSTKQTDRKTASRTMSSHKMVEMAPNTRTPLMLKDGEFVFIDEESCIGCMQCVNVSPGSFLMMESGRARTFEQRQAPDVKQAVASCPVNCMHRVTFAELAEYETARDEGDGRNDHKHLGHRRGHTPLHVAGIDSDNNHRTSWYHTLKGKCVTSSQCPQKGCYDCPRYAKPGDNPYFQKNQQHDNHIRAQHFIERGDLDVLRKVAEL